MRRNTEDNVVGGVARVLNVLEMAVQKGKEREPKLAGRLSYPNKKGPPKFVSGCLSPRYQSLFCILKHHHKCLERLSCCICHYEDLYRPGEVPSTGLRGVPCAEMKRARYIHTKRRAIWRLNAGYALYVPSRIICRRHLLHCSLFSDACPTAD